MEKITKSFPVAIVGKSGPNDAWAFAFIKEGCSRSWPAEISEEVSVEIAEKISRKAWSVMVETAVLMTTEETGYTVSSMYMNETRKELMDIQIQSVFFSAHDGKKGWPKLREAFVRNLEKLTGAKMVLEMESKFQHHQMCSDAKNLSDIAVDHALCQKDAREGSEKKVRQRL